MNHIKGLFVAIATIASIPASSMLAEDSFDLVECSFDESDDRGCPSILDCSLPPGDCNITDFQVVDLLATAGAQDVLQFNIWKNSYPLVQRSVHDFPTLRNRRPYDISCRRLTTYAFFNYTERMYYTRCSDTIDSYIDLRNPDLLEVLDNLPGVEDIDIPDLLSLFEPVKLQQRLLGFMFEGHKQYESWYIHAQVPLLYRENNFFLEPEEAQRIASSPALRDLEPSSTNTVTDFARQHLINDKLGIGSTRLEAGLQACTNDHTQLWLAVQATLPTSWTWKEGLYGAKFPKYPRQPCWSWKKLVALGNDVIGSTCNNFDEAIQYALDFGTAALDRLTRAAADYPLGEEFFGFGPLVKFQLDEGCWHFITEARIHGYVPRKQPRFFITETAESAFDRDYGNPDAAQANLAFFDRETVNRFFPVCKCVYVWPGYVAQITASYLLDVDEGWGEVGVDAWYQSAEHANTPSPTCAGDNNSFKPLCAPEAYQIKFFASVGRPYDICRNRVTLSVHGDVTWPHKGIGRDWTVALSLDSLF